ncbi:Gfo/Idh/MocA family protein [Ruminococcus difficilis]|uniref:Gfo/Idh/MocA family oxidoreductase n=1 Tax=Ruminococcus difficilis TaxID=2763069 RepID=A0A934WR28_9FIRM|nr:Gfo/Idh/MocA family oxidoreductase [Ruminococcus difficilis]MBK6087622.1 Gfo/Idh/MocA family oxidoreductase [Ruminococcus difficilis]
MSKIRIGVICPSEIAFRRFMPALNEVEEFEFSGVAIAAANEWNGEYSDSILESELMKAQGFIENYGGKIFMSYSSLIEDESIDAVYLPLPPALHYRWGMKALENNKHLFIEKPSTTSAEDTESLISLAESKDLAIHENYMFVYHKQITEIMRIIESGEIGDVRLYRIAFGFPRRSINDFRYNKELGGGTLLDNGGYTVKLASILLGETARIVCSNLNYIEDFKVDIFGTATMINDSGLTAQLSFGMDNCYKCDLEVWGSKGNLFTNRIFTAPAGFTPKLVKKVNNDPDILLNLPEDSSFEKSIREFLQCISLKDKRVSAYKSILKQARLIDNIREINQ